MVNSSHPPGPEPPLSGSLLSIPFGVLSQTVVESLLGTQSLEAMQQIMSHIDTNGDGDIGMDEWLAFMHKPDGLGDPVSFEDLEQSFREAVANRWHDSSAAFKEIDFDGNGTLQLEELQVAHQLPRSGPYLQH